MAQRRFRQHIDASFWVGRRVAICAAIVGLNAFLTLPSVQTAYAQQVSPRYDPRQFDQRFNENQSDRGTSDQRRPPMPKLARSTPAAADPTPLFVLRRVSIVGAHAISPDLLATVYQPYIGKKVSQADLVTVASGISDVYRNAGFHLSRAIIPPQEIG